MQKSNIIWRGEAGKVYQDWRKTNSVCDCDATEEEFYQMDK